MARKSNAKKKKSARKKKPGPPIWERVDTERLRRVLPGFALALAGVGAALGTGIGIDRLSEASANARLAEPVSVRMLWPEGDRGAWLAPALRSDIEELALAAAENDRDPFSRAQLARVGDELERSGWFDGRPIVRRAADGAIEVEGVWRRPAAYVRTREGDRLVSAQGKLMPLLWRPAGSGPALLLVTNTLHEPPLRTDGRPDYASPWAGKDIEAGLALASMLAGEPYAEAIAEIDLAPFNTRQRLELVVRLSRDAAGAGRSRSRIHWGGPTGVFNPEEPSDEDKLARLRAMFAESRWRDWLLEGGAVYDLVQNQIVRHDSVRRP
ncbi:MAG: hypothetical protein EA423_02215 [Phycisphaerales bacterium]|nr:MAG: hypothetical protein EA423_02215 [Phycisphaerales bacterium]